MLSRDSEDEFDQDLFELTYDMTCEDFNCRSRLCVISEDGSESEIEQLIQCLVTFPEHVITTEIRNRVTDTSGNHCQNY